MKKTIKYIFFSFVLVCSDISYAQNTPQISDEQAHQIVIQGTPDDVKSLIQSGYDVNRVYLCNTLLTEAVNSSAGGTSAPRNPLYALEKIKLLVNAGANINQVPCPDSSMPALHWAVFLPSFIKDIEYDVNKTIDERIKNKTDECNFPGVVSKPCGEVTPEEREKIRIAIRDSMKYLNNMLTPNFMEIIDYLVNNGADVNLPSGTFEITPIHLAAMNPSDTTIGPLRYLIEKGSDINVQDIDGNTPLFWAWGVENNEAVDLLIKAGADTSIKNKEGLRYNDVGAQQLRILRKHQGKVITEE